MPSPCIDAKRLHLRKDVIGYVNKLVILLGLDAVIYCMDN